VTASATAERSATPRGQPRRHRSCHAHRPQLHSAPAHGRPDQCLRNLGIQCWRKGRGCEGEGHQGTPKEVEGARGVGGGDKVIPPSEKLLQSDNSELKGSAATCASPELMRMRISTWTVQRAGANRVSAFAEHQCQFKPRQRWEVRSLFRNIEVDFALAAGKLEGQHAIHRAQRRASVSLYLC